MYRLKEIISSLQGLVGWRQEHSMKKKIEDKMTQSSSGLYYQDVHPLMTLENVRSIMPDYWIEGYKDWVCGEHYNEGDLVAYLGKCYIRLVSGDDGYPSIDEDKWREYDMFSDFLEKQTEGGVVKAIQQFITTKVNAKETRNLLENRLLFDGAGRLADIVENKGRMVGFEITPLRQEGITMCLEKIGYQFRSAVGNVTLYLFHSSQPNPIATFNASVSDADGGMKWLTLGVDAKTKTYLNYSKYSGGSYYLCYHQSSLPKWMDAVNYARDWSREPCMSCNRGNVQEWREMTKYVRISPFAVDCEYVEGESPKLWDLADMIYTPHSNYGLNFQYSIGCDITDFIIAQRDIFANVVQMQVAYNILKTIANNPNVRVNRNQANASSLLYDLDGESSGRPTGLAHDLSKAYKALDIDTKGMAKVCLGCSNKGLIYGSM